MDTLIYSVSSFNWGHTESRTNLNIPVDNSNTDFASTWLVRCQPDSINTGRMDFHVAYVKYQQN